jgi:hypothetical protein
MLLLASPALPKGYADRMVFYPRHIVTCETQYEIIRTDEALYVVRLPSDCWQELVTYE